MTEKPIVEFWFELASSYSYLSAFRVDGVAARYGVHVDWKPVFLGGVFRAHGQPLDSPFNVHPVKGEYMWREVERYCSEAGLPFTKPKPFPQNTVYALRAACYGKDKPWMKDYVREAFRMEYSGLVDLSQQDVIAGLLKKVGAPVEECLEAITKPEIKDELRSLTDQAIAKGLFGAPTFYTPDGEMFWGNDRMEQAFAWAVRADRGGTRV